MFYDALSAVKPENRHGLAVDGMENALFMRMNKFCHKNIVVHALRHSFVSLAYHLDIPIWGTKAICEWSDYGRS